MRVYNNFKVVYFYPIRDIIRSGFFILVILSASSCMETKTKDEKAVTETIQYTNPLNVEFGDPYILNDGSGTYYMYGTGGGADDGFVTYSSKNLVDWKFERQVYTGNTDDSWATTYFWAPEVYYFKDKYYMFYSAQWRENPNNDLENFRIGVAVSDSPLGPFNELNDGPLFDSGYPIIDANVFKDEDGTFYLYYSRVCYEHPVESEIAQWARDKGWFEEIEESWVYGVELSPNFDSVVGEPVLLLQPPSTMGDKNAEWESRSVMSKEVNRRWTEGSFTFKHNDLYYMMYSANYFGGEHYAVGYATASHPLGPYAKATHNPILEKNTESGGEVTGTGHNSLVFMESGEIYTVYHGRTKETGDERVVFLDPLIIKDDGSLEVDGPSTQSKPLPYSSN